MLEVLGDIARLVFVGIVIGCVVAFCLAPRVGTRRIRRDGAFAILDPMLAEDEVFLKDVEVAAHNAYARAELWSSLSGVED